MLDFNKDKKKMKAYRNGFGIGVFIGICYCIYVGKPLFMLPVVLGLLFGAMAFDYNYHDNDKDDGIQNKRTDH